MKKYSFLTLFMLVTFMVNAQDVDKKYLAGAVPEVDGKIIFKKSIMTNRQLSDAELFQVMDKWASENMDNKNGLNGRVLLSDSKKNVIACSFEKYLVFKDVGLILDRAKMISQLIMEIKDGRCDITVRNIKYDYSEDEKPFPAEEMITDALAINKEGNKLNRYYGKFRTNTIDQIDNLANSIDTYLNGASQKGVAITQQPVTVQQPVVGAEKVSESVLMQPATVVNMPGFKNVLVDKIPSGILNKQALIMTGTIQQPVIISGLWGGTTTLLDKLMALSTTHQSKEAISNGQTYTISFYTEIYSDAVANFESAGGNVKDKISRAGLTAVATPSGAPTFSEAWMVIECRKAGVLPSKGASVTDLGEILNVWVK